MMARMDGDKRSIKLIRNSSRPLPYNFFSNIAIDFGTSRIYWAGLDWFIFDSGYRPTIESTDLDGNRWSSTFLVDKFHFPWQLIAHEGYLYWAGGRWAPESVLLQLTGNGGGIFKARLTDMSVQFEIGKEELLTGNLTTITGLTIYRFSPKFSKTSVRGENGTCETYGCTGVCLLAGADSFSCACAEGQVLDSNGTCRNDTQYPMILSTLNGSIYVTNESGTFPVHSAKNLSSLAYNAKRNAILWTERDAHYFTVHEVGHMSNDSGSGQRLTLKFSADTSVGPLLLEYDFVGNNIFFQSGSGKIWVCSRETAACKTVIENVTRTTKAWSDADNGQRIGFALDPRHGTMYWLVMGAIFTGLMDGSNYKQIQTSMTGRAVAIHLDQGSGLLYWVIWSVGTRGASSFQIVYAGLHDQNPQVLIRLADDVRQLQTAGNHVFWLSSSSRQLFSCRKTSADGLKRHEFKGGEEQRFDNFYVIHSENQPTMVVNPCAGNLCSHICIPTPTGYMRCLCPAGLELLANGRTCAHPGRKNGIKSPKMPKAEVVKNLEGNCREDHVPCLFSSQCIHLKLVCDGMKNCNDFSDEGPRCDEPCPRRHGCSYSCIRSPISPICICPFGQVLANDTKTCNTPPPGPSDGGSSMVIGSVLGSVVVLLLVICIIALWKYRLAKGELRDLTEQEIREFFEGDVTLADVAPAGVERAMLLPYTIILNPENITVDSGKVLGSGEYGVVCRGFCNEQPVAIKAIKGAVNVDKFKALLAEVKIMAYLGDHENIVKLVGAEVSQIAQRKITIVTELSPHGDLLRYLWKVAKESSKHPVARLYENVEELELMQILSLTMVRWCEQISAGMEHLTAKQIVHGDLAARNVLVFPGNVVKVADFGMSRQLYGSTQYQMKKPRKLPWKWASPELLSSGVFSEASDVWAFGVTAWEIYSFGEAPYKGFMQLEQQFIDSVQMGMRLQKPNYAPEEIYKVMLECWSAERSHRPTFATIRRFFHEQASLIQSQHGTVVCSSEDRFYDTVF